jgi:kinetochore protein Spc25
MAHVLRLPQINLTSVLAQPNPQVDLRLNVYEASTRNFLKAVTNYKNRAITVIAERRKNQNAELKRVTEKIHLVESETNQCKIKEIELLAGASYSSIDALVR